MKKSTKQTLLGGVAVTCLLVIAPALIESYPLLSVVSIAAAGVCCYFGELDELVDEEVNNDEISPGT